MRKTTAMTVTEIKTDQTLVSQANASPALEQTASTTLDRTAFSVSHDFDNAEDTVYWWSRTPEERLRHIEYLRRMNYGHRACEGLQRILEVAQRGRS
ncbi:MAG: hypothetical protein NTX50_20145 [Candidatus Sumerlaeota bacterium]|nr:hypothetical protein [Candidatus Sumerlaeota bacterium]